MRVGASEQTLTLEQVVVHRKFKGQSGGHDVALLKLPSTKGHCLTFDPNTNAACLPPADSGSGGNTPSSCVVMVSAGWTGPGIFFYFLLYSIQCNALNGNVHEFLKGSLVPEECSCDGNVARVFLLNA